MRFRDLLAIALIALIVIYVGAIWALSPKRQFVPEYWNGPMLCGEAGQPAPSDCTVNR